MNRRRFVKAFGGSIAGRMILGPVASSLMIPKTHAQALGNLPKFISFVTPIGHHDDWLPSSGFSQAGTGNMTLGEVGKPLEPHKNDIMYIRDVWSAYRYHSGSGAHRAGYPSATTGAVHFDEDPSPAAGISIDQFLIKKWNAKGQSLEMSIGGSSDYSSYISWLASKQPIIPTKNPKTVFDATFRGLSNGDPAQAAMIRARGQSLLDVWTQEIKRLEAILGQDHRLAMDAHLEQLNQLEKSLNEVIVCSPPSDVNAKSFYDDVGNNFPTIGKHFMDITVSAFSCGVRRTASLAWSDAGSRIRHKWLPGMHTHHHGISHDADKETRPIKIAMIDKWYTEQFAYLLKKLKEVDAGEGPLLNSTIVYWGSETGNAFSHSGAGMRVLLAGNYNNHFKMGRYYRLNQVPLNNLLAEISTALGAPINKFGNPDFATGQMPEIRA